MFKQFGVNALFVAALAVAMVGALSSAAPLDQFDGQTVVANNTRALFRFYGYLQMGSSESADEQKIVDVQSALANPRDMCRYKLVSEPAELEILSSIFTSASPMIVWSIAVNIKSFGEEQTSCLIKPQIKVPARHHYSCDKTVSYPCMDLEDSNKQVAVLVASSFEFEYYTDPKMASHRQYQFPAFQCD